jgi:hypothetical protein
VSLDAESLAELVVQTVDLALAPLLERVKVLEAHGVPPEIAPEDIAASVAGLLRKELADLDLTPPRTQKRIVRDAQGQIERVIEEVT